MEAVVSKQVPGAANDPYVHCLYSLFTLSFYYDANTTKVASQHYQLSALTWPALTYVAQHVHQYEKDKQHYHVEEQQRLERMRLEQKKEKKEQEQGERNLLYDTCIYD